MAKNKTRQTFEKRKRERDKQDRQQAKQVERQARSAAKREAKESGDGDTTGLPVRGMANYSPDEDISRLTSNVSPNRDEP